jgi:hypothetical protein
MILDSREIIDGFAIATIDFFVIPTKGRNLASLVEPKSLPAGRDDIQNSCETENFGQDRENIRTCA